MIFILLIFINILITLLIKSDKKYFAIIIAWILLLASYIGWRSFKELEFEKMNNKYWESAKGQSGGNFELYEKMEVYKTEFKSNNLLFLNLIVLQTFLTLVFQINGYLSTKKKALKWTLIIFSGLTIILLFFLLMISIVPKQGIIG